MQLIQPFNSAVEDSRPDHHEVPVSGDSIGHNDFCQESPEHSLTSVEIPF